MSILDQPIPQLIVLISRWWKHFRDQFTGPTGWKLIVPPLTFLAGFFTIVAAFMSYQSGNLDHEMEAADRSYSQLMGDAGNDSVRTRISAIHRIPPMLYRAVPETSDIGPWEALRLTFGFHRREPAKYQNDMQLLILDLLAEIRAGNSADPQREVKALIDLLVELGPEGWYRAMPRKNHSTPEQGLQWLWVTPRQFTPSDRRTVILLDGVPMDRIDLSDFALTSAELRVSSMSHMVFNRSHLTAADLTGTCATETHFEFAHLDQANLSKAHMPNCHFESSILTGALTNKSDFSGSHFENADLSHSQGTGANFVGAKLMGSIVANSTIESDYFDVADFTGANLSHSVADFSRFERAILRGAELEGASLRRADLFGADLSDADVSGVDFRDADLRGANLSGTRNLFKDTILIGANVSGVRGLSTADFRRMLTSGAVLAGKPMFLPLPVQVNPCKIELDAPEALNHKKNQVAVGNAKRSAS